MLSAVVIVEHVGPSKAILSQFAASSAYNIFNGRASTRRTGLKQKKNITTRQFFCRFFHVPIISVNVPFAFSSVQRTFCVLFSTIPMQINNYRTG